MKPLYIFLIFYLFLQNNAFAQCISASEVQFLPQDVATPIAKKIESSKTFSTFQIDEMKAKLDQCRLEVETAVRKKNAEFDDVMRNIRKLLSVQDVGAIRTKIQQLEKSKTDAQAKTDVQLGGVTYKGLYLVVLRNIGAFESPEALSAKVQTAVTSPAITDLNGAFMQSLTKMVNNQVEFDRVKQRVSGNMTIGQPVYQQTIGNEKLHIRLVELEVASYAKFKQTVNTNSSAAPASTTNAEVVKITADFNVEDFIKKTIAASEVASRESDNLKRLIGIRQNAVSAHNTSSGSAQEDVHRQARNDVEDYDRRITDEQRNLNNYAQTVKEVLQTVGFKDNCANENLEACIAKARKQLEDKLLVINKEKAVEQEKELVYKDVTIKAEDVNPTLSIANQAISTSKELNNTNGTLTQFFQEIQMENGMVANYSETRSRDAYRSIESTQLYIAPGNASDFRVLVVAKFKLTTSEKPKSASFASPQTTTQPQSTWNDAPAKEPSAAGQKFNFKQQAYNDMWVGKMLPIQGGYFVMGDYSDKIRTQKLTTVKVSSFYMSQYEITNGQYCEFLNTYFPTGRNVSSMLTATQLTEPDCYIFYENGKWQVLYGQDDKPVNYVTWSGASAFCIMLSLKTGRNYRLPTSAEWEYAAGGGAVHNTYSWGMGPPKGSQGGNIINQEQNANGLIRNEFPNYDDGYKVAIFVGRYAPNPFGLYDMSGNVQEWCYENYNPAFFDTPSYTDPCTDISKESTTADKCVKGGSYKNHTEFLRIGNTMPLNSTKSGGGTGFRVVCVQ
jgi:formylglycine-generating enzyme